MNDDFLKKAARIAIPFLIFVLIVFLTVRTGSKKEETKEKTVNGMGDKAAQIADQIHKNAAENTSGADASSAGNQTDAGTAIANPFVTVKSSADFAPTGIMIDAPGSSTNVQYMIMNETVPVVDFKYGVTQYRFEATKTDEDLAVFYGEEESVEVVDDSAFAMLTVYKGLGSKLTWSKNGVNYFLTCSDTDTKGIKEVYELLK